MIKEFSAAVTANVHLWGLHVGAICWDESRQLGHFSYSDEFCRNGLPVAPVTMPLKADVYAFPELNANVFKGLPGFLADSLPDKFGNRIIEAWAQRAGHSPALNPVERLLLIHDRAMGALEFTPVASDSRFHDSGPKATTELAVDLGEMVTLINHLISQPEALPPVSGEMAQTLELLLQMGMSADGARAKAVIGLNPATNEVRPGHRTLADDFGYWLLKFDGITGNRDREADDPQGYGLIEYTYYLMARAAGITIAESRLLHENGRHHFVTRRFDRTDAGGKVHRQSLCALGHMDFDAAGRYSYEQVMEIIKTLDMPQSTLEEQFRRTAFNIIARNHDDHAKNTAFLMSRQGAWSLAPAYDLTFAYNPEGQWTNQHQMTLNGKRDHFDSADFLALSRRFAIDDARALTIIQQVTDAVAQWPELAREAGVDAESIAAISRELRLSIV